MSKIYTKTGDKGETSLISGERLPKSDPQIDLYGKVDELNAFIGVVASHWPESSNYEWPSADKVGRQQDMLVKIQHNLFNLGSLLACEPSARDKYKLPSLKESLITELETQIDSMNEVLPELKNFILPGGSPLAGHAHICRTICRGVERKLVNLQEQGFVTPEHSIPYLNRLSDYFFTLARFGNWLLNTKEILWESDRA